MLKLLQKITKNSHAALLPLALLLVLTSSSGQAQSADLTAGQRNLQKASCTIVKDVTDLAAQAVSAPCLQFDGVGELSSPLIVAGRFIVARDAELNLKGTELIVKEGAEFLQRGILRLNQATLQLAGFMQNQGQVNLDDKSAFEGAVSSMFKNAGRFEADRSVLKTEGRLENSSVLSLFGACLSSTGSRFANNGTVRLSGQAELKLDKEVYFENHGSLQSGPQSVIELAGQSQLINMRSVEAGGVLRQRDETRLVNRRQIEMGPTSTWYLGERAVLINRQQVQCAGQVIFEEMTRLINQGTFDLSREGSLTLKDRVVVVNKGNLRLRGRFESAADVRIEGRNPVNLSGLSLGSSR